MLRRCHLVFSAFHSPRRRFMSAGAAGPKACPIPARSHERLRSRVYFLPPFGLPFSLPPFLLSHGMSSSTFSATSIA